MATPRTVRSRDGALIAYERVGTGAPVILVCGALQSRGSFDAYAQDLAARFTVVSYDRRGRGDSDDIPPYSVEREVDDLDALIADAGGPASLYGHSSGAALVLHAAARGLPIDKIVLHDPPFGSGSDEEQQAEQQEAGRIAQLLQQERRAEALKLFVTSAGAPAEVAEAVSVDPTMLANAPSLLYDPYEITSKHSRGGRTVTEQARTITTPALVLIGEESPDFMHTAAGAIANALPHGKLKVLSGQDHVVPPDVLTPVLAEFLAGRPTSSLLAGSSSRWRRGESNP